MKKSGLMAAFALTAISFVAGAGLRANTVLPPSGDGMPDDTLYVDTSPDTHKPLYTTPADAPGTYAESEGMAYCQSLNASGHKDWRVPTKDELNVLWENRDKGKLQGTFNETGSYPAGWYWSSTPYSTISAWAQRFSDGLQGINYFRDYDSSLRCVR